MGTQKHFSTENPTGFHSTFCVLLSRSTAETYRITACGELKLAAVLHEEKRQTQKKV